MDCPPGIAFGDPEGRLVKPGKDEEGGVGPCRGFTPLCR
jgi:hypothetical protein